MFKLFFLMGIGYSIFNGTLKKKKKEKIEG